MTRLIFYSETSVLGGHEKMALAAHLALLKYCGEKFDICWILNEGNHRLIEELRAASLPHNLIECDHPIDVRKPSLGAIRQVLSISREFHRLKPDLIIVLQGGIVASYSGILAARLSGINFCSYIPMAPRSTELSPYRFPKIWDTLRSVYFKLIPKYITIDHTQAFNILREYRHATVRVIENYTSLSPITELSKSEARSRLCLPEDVPVIGVLGRIEFGQKAQDWLVTELGRDPFLGDKLLLIVGEGPDASRLKEILPAQPYARNIRLVGWQSDMGAIYSAIDLVLVPSRFEGVPLVMLEALSRQIPVVGVDRDGMASWLPQDWRFPFGDVDLMKKALQHGLGKGEIDWSPIKAHLSQVANEQRFAREFETALDEFSSDFGTVVWPRRGS